MMLLSRVVADRGDLVRKDGQADVVGILNDASEFVLNVGRPRRDRDQDLLWLNVVDFEQALRLMERGEFLVDKLLGTSRKESSITGIYM